MTVAAGGAGCRKGGQHVTFEEPSPTNSGASDGGHLPHLPLTAAATTPYGHMGVSSLAKAPSEGVPGFPSLMLAVHVCCECHHMSRVAMVCLCACSGLGEGWHDAGAVVAAALRAGAGAGGARK